MPEAKVSRGLYINGKPRLVCPTNEQVRKINSHKNAEYFTTLRDQPEIVPEDWHGDTSELFRERVIDPLAQILSTDQEITRYPADNIGIRGSACSLGVN